MISIIRQRDWILVDNMYICIYKYIHAHVYIRYTYIIHNVNKVITMDVQDNLANQGARVAEIIKNEGLTQADFAQRTGIKTSTLNHVIKGRNNISPIVLRQISNAFPQYNTDWIKNGEGDMIIGTNYMSSRLHLFPESDLDLIASSTPENIPIASSISAEQCSVKLPHLDIDTNPAHIKRKVKKIIIYYDDNTFETFVHGEK